MFVLRVRPLTDHPVDVGLRSEHALVNRFVQLGYAVFLPVGPNHRYDLLLEHEAGRFLRVQCKTGRLRGGVIRFSTLSTRSNRKDVLRRGYAGEVDAFAVWCPQTGTGYFLPANGVPAGVVTLRVCAPENQQRRGIRWAADYALPEPAPPGAPLPPSATIVPA